eukprot:TRINITY_DN32886_c0_g1_i1.p1 TRINITY_DN32886_c0_g1~~TRINITY_DN32886_c0_g1_i1.p1  ORF type:complete len:350 (-),score=52.09 TRINITY_DN32886_c0_g1_i1:113-1162(-)
MLQPVCRQATFDALKGLVQPVTRMRDDLNCAVCLEPAFGGVQTACEHIFHESCLQRAFGAQGNRCPTCRSVLEDPAYKPLHRILRNELEEQPVRCPQECGAEVPWGQLNDHVCKNCPNMFFACTNHGCSVVLAYSALEAHILSCEHRGVVCSCGLQLKQKDLDDHLSSVCPEQEMACRYCGQGGKRRKLMDAHLREHCQAAAPISLVKRLEDMMQTAQVALGRLQAEKEQMQTAQAALEGRQETLEAELRAKAATISELRAHATGPQQVVLESKTQVVFRLPSELGDLPQGYTSNAFRGWQVRIVPRGLANRNYVSIFVRLSKHLPSPLEVPVELTIAVGNISKSVFES